MTNQEKLDYIKEVLEEIADLPVCDSDVIGALKFVEDLKNTKGI